MDKNKLVSFILRSGLAIVFLYAGIAAFITPTNWIGFIPNVVEYVIPKTMFLTIFSSYEILLALWLLSNKKAFYSSIVASLTMVAIVIPNILAFDIVFRDIAILFMAIASSILSKKK